MAYYKSQWEWRDADDFGKLAADLIAKEPDRYRGFNLRLIQAYQCVKHPPDSKLANLTQIHTESDLLSGHNAPRFFVQLPASWSTMSEAERLELVASVLCRIDPDRPGHLKPRGGESSSNGS